MQMTSLSFWLTIASRAMAVFPVWRSPRISSRCPLPTGMRASMTLIPVSSGAATGSRSMIAGAGCSRGVLSRCGRAPFSSRGLPVASITRPSNASPTTTSATRPSRFTSWPALSEFPVPSRIMPTFSGSRPATMPRVPSSVSTSSSAVTRARPLAYATGPLTEMIRPTSSACSVKEWESRVRWISVMVFSRAVFSIVPAIRRRLPSPGWLSAFS